MLCLRRALLYSSVDREITQTITLYRGGLHRESELSQSLCAYLQPQTNLLNDRQRLAYNDQRVEYEKEKSINFDPGLIKI